MSDYRWFKTSFWKDNYIDSLTAQEKLVFIYSLTNPDTHVCGVYQVRLKDFTDTGLPLHEVAQILKKFETDGKMKYQDGWLALKNWIKHQKTGSKFVDIGINNGLLQSPKWCRDYVGYTGTIETRIPEYKKPKHHNTNNQKIATNSREIEKKKREENMKKIRDICENLPEEAKNELRERAIKEAEKMKLNYNGSQYENMIEGIMYGIIERELS